MMLDRILTTACATAAVSAMMSWAAQAQSTDEPPTMRTFRQLRMGMTDAEASRILKRPLPRSCSVNWRVVDITSGDQKFSYGATPQGRIWTTRREIRIHGDLRLGIQNLFAEAKKAQCWLEEPRKIEKSRATLTERSGDFISKADMWCAVWPGGEARFCLEEPIEIGDPFTAICLQNTQLDLRKAFLWECPTDYAFCKKRRFSFGGSRF